MNIKNIILSIILAIVILGLVILGMVYWPKKSANTNNANASANTNQLVKVTLPPDAGDIQVNKKVTFKSIEFSLTTAARLSEFHTKTAAAGEKYIVLFLAPLSGTGADKVIEWLSKDARLVTGTKEIVPEQTKTVLASATSVNESGYIWFVVKEADKDFTLQLGAGDDKKTVALGF